MKPKNVAVCKSVFFVTCEQTIKTLPYFCALSCILHDKEMGKEPDPPHRSVASCPMSSHSSHCMGFWKTMEFFLFLPPASLNRGGRWTTHVNHLPPPPPVSGSHVNHLLPPGQGHRSTTPPPRPGSHVNYFQPPRKERSLTSPPPPPG